MSKQNKAVHVFSSALIGVHAHLIEIESDFRPGMIATHIVGLPDKSCQESKQRIKSALKNSGIPLPQCQVILNLAPANIPKSGSGFDLAMAIAIAARQGNIPKELLHESLFLGELSLSGKLRSIPGVLASCQLAKELNYKYVFIPKEHIQEASLIKGISIYACESLKQILDHLTNIKQLYPIKYSNNQLKTKPNYKIDFLDIKGHELAKQALIISASGNHHLLMSGPPGSGKTMLAQSMISILPPLLIQEIIDVKKIYSASNINQNNITQRPFRSPHHSASASALVGGGTIPKPGEITLAHKGVLFLDELPEFPRMVLETLRQPLEDKKICIARAHQTVQFPADFLLIAAMNPCPCGFVGDKKSQCTCSVKQVESYQQKISGPLLDRFDLKLYVPKLDWDILSKSNQKSLSSSQIQKRISKTRSIQHKRQNCLNGLLPSKQLIAGELFDIQAIKFLQNFAQNNNLSNRSYYKLLRVARTIADLNNESLVIKSHLIKALMFRI